MCPLCPHDKDIKTAFNQHIGLILKAFGKVSLNLEAVILYGGYARNEGSWIIEQNGNCRPYNDYDILLVIENKIPIDRIGFLRKELAEQIGIRWVDIDQKTPAELKKLKATIYNYDLKYASRVIQGDPNVFNLIPEINASRLPLKEAETLYITRLWTLLGSLDSKGLSVDREGEESRFFRNQMAKAVLAVVDALLLQKGAYHPSYKERIKRLDDLFPEKDELGELSKWALEEKLRPKAPYMKQKYIRKLYSKVHQFFINEMYNVLSKYYKCQVCNPGDIETHIKYSRCNMVKRIGWLVLRRNTTWERKIAVNLAQSYITSAYSEMQIDEKFLQRGIRYIKYLDASFPEDSSWDEARVKVAHLRMEV